MNEILKNYKGKVLVSPCLLGLKTRFDGKSKPDSKLIEILKNKDIVFYCPEQGGGLSTPRLPAEIEFGKNSGDVIDGNAKILNSNGEDVSEQYLKGAHETLNICKKFGIELVILKSKSPSCGYKKIYNGKFDGTLVDGNGVTAELLEQNNIKIFTEKDFS